MRSFFNKSKIAQRTVYCLLGLAIAVVSSGCAGYFFAREHENAYLEEETGQKIKTEVLDIRANVFGYSVKGRPMAYVKFGEGEDISLVFGAIHGDEGASETLCLALLSWLKAQQSLPPEISIVVAPVTNPDGLIANTRVNANGVDLNRNFPTSNRVNNARYGHEALSEPESTALYQLMERYLPNRIISIHQPVACVDYDGPARGMAEAMAAVCDLPVQKLGARPGSFGSYAGVDSNIPTVTLELRREDDNLTVEQIWQAYGRAMLAGISYDSPVSLKLD